MPGQPRSIDHVVLPTADLSRARTRLNALGFTVAPPARHPFGTENACVYFADNTFLEPLAIASHDDYAAAARAGNVFVSRDRAFRSRNGEEGFSAIAFASKNADADDAGFHAAGISAGQALSFNRTFATPAGETAEAGFKLAFAADPRAPDVFFFTCERTHAPAVNRSTLEVHANGVMGIAQVLLCASESSESQNLLREIVNRPAVATDASSLSLDARNRPVQMLGPAAMNACFGSQAEAALGGVRLRAVVFFVRDPDMLKHRLAQTGIAFETRDRRVIVAAEPGQGAIFCFEERP